MSISQVANTNLASQASAAGRLNTGTSALEKSGDQRAQFGRQLGSDSVTLSTQSVATASANVSKEIRQDGTQAFTDRAGKKSGTQGTSEFAVKAVNEGADWKEERDGQKRNMQLAAALNGFIKRIGVAINGE